MLTDFPYGTLNKRNEWDTIIDYPRFWKQVDRICKPNTAIISTAAQPFTSKLISSNYRDFKYTLVWEKSKASGYLNAKKQPLKAHEDIVVFYKNKLHIIHNLQLVFLMIKVKQLEIPKHTESKLKQFM